MFVRPKVGAYAGQIVDMRYEHAIGCIQAGTHEPVSEDDVAGLRNQVPTIGYGVNASESMPLGYVAVPDPEYGYMVADPGGAFLNQGRPFPNLAAARSYAHEHAVRQQGLDPRIVRAAIEHRATVEAGRAEDEKRRLEALDRAEEARKAELTGGLDVEISPTGMGVRRDPLGPKPADDRGARDRVPPKDPRGGTDGPRPAGAR